MDTHGWDVVAACSQTRLNALLADRLSKTPPTLSYSDGAGLAITATFDPWQIASFGSDNRLSLILPIRTGILTSSSKFAAVPKVALDGAQVEVMIDLTFLTDTKAGKADLRFNFATAAKSANDISTGAVFVVNADLTGALAKADPSGSAAQAISDHFPACLIANADGLGFALSTLDLAPTGDAAWLAPVAMEYLFVQGTKTASGAQGPGYLAVLSMVRTLDPATRTREIDAALCDGGHDLCVALNKDIFLQRVILPMLPGAFVGAQASQFAMSGDSIMSFAPLMCPPVTNAGTSYQPVLFTFQVSIASDQLVSRVSGIFDITGLTDSYVTFTIEQGLHCRYDATSGGLALAPAGPPVTDYEKHIPWWIYAVGAVALPVVGLVAGIVVVAVVDAVVAAVSSAVARKVTASGGTSAIGNWTYAAIGWPGSATWTVEDAGLSDALYLRGSLT